jgi:hypothetical protein
MPEPKSGFAAAAVNAAAEICKNLRLLSITSPLRRRWLPRADRISSLAVSRGKKEFCHATESPAVA